MTTTMTPYRSRMQHGTESFAHLLRSEWTKFRTVRGWVIAMVVAGVLTVLIGLLGAEGSHSSFMGKTPANPSGPGGESVIDSFSFFHQPLSGDGTITAHLDSLTGMRLQPQQPGLPPTGEKGLMPWSKAGLMIKSSLAQGSSYVAIVMTGSHGVRLQDNFVNDRAAPASVANAAWLRLTRAGNTVTAWASTDGTQWTRTGSARLSGAGGSVQAGLFATSPQHLHGSASLGSSSVTGGPSSATAVFDHVGLQGGTSPGQAWKGEAIGNDEPMTATVPSFQHSGDAFTLTGTGDVAPAGSRGPGVMPEQTLNGVFAGLIAVVVVATLFVTAEYGKGLIRTTFAATPRRGRVLAAKALVVGAVAFVVGLVAAVISLPLNEHVLRANGNLIKPIPASTEIRLLVGTAALVAASAVLALGLGAILRHSATAITTVIAAITLPYIVASSGVLALGPTDWLLRLTPAAAFAIHQSTPPYHQIDDVTSPWNGYYPLPPLLGLGVLFLYAALTLMVAVRLLNRRDA